MFKVRYVVAILGGTYPYTPIEGFFYQKDAEGKAKRARDFGYNVRTWVSTEWW